jgi:glutamine synthetase
MRRRREHDEPIDRAFWRERERRRPSALVVSMVVVVSVLAFATIAGVAFLWPHGHLKRSPVVSPHTVGAKVIRVVPIRCAVGGNRGCREVFARVLGGRGDPATRLENRLGEPAANPYLYIASQIVAGLDGIERSLKLGPRDDEPYSAERPLLSTNLGQALEALESSALFRRQFGDVFVNYYLKLKRSEYGRYRQWLDAARVPEDEPTQWEQDEYFDFF